MSTPAIRIDVFVHQVQDPKLEQILAALQTLIKGELKMSAELDALTAQVTNNTSAEQSAITLLNNLAALITASKTDPVALTNLASTLQTSGAALAAAIVANTPAA